MTVREYPPPNWLAVDNEGRLGRLCGGATAADYRGPGEALPEELGDTAEPTASRPSLSRDRYSLECPPPGRTHLRGYELHWRHQLWVPCVERHPPYKPPSTWRDEL